MSLSTFEREIAELIVETLDLEDVTPDDIRPDEQLFGDEGLGLDSIDALELALEVSRQYGFQLRADDPDNRRIFGSIRELASHILSKRSGQ